VPRDYPVGIVIADEVPKVPNVVKLTMEDATKLLEQRGYAIAAGETIPSADIAQGLIIDQTPKADSPQAKGSTVTVRVSAGAGDVEVPKVLGVSFAKAKDDLEKLGVKVVVHWVALAETPTYVVLNQKPAPGQKVKPGSEVTLTVCRQ
jgi:eukaryotic-like serine/threonine-protein kinase